VTGRVVSAAVLLVIGAGLALLALLVHYEFMRIYGDVSGTAFEGLTWGLTAGPSGVAFGLVAVVAVIGFILSTRRWMRLTAVVIPVLVLLGMLARRITHLGVICWWFSFFQRDQREAASAESLLAAGGLVPAVRRNL
jgi:hypothetical protein